MGATRPFGARDYQSGETILRQTTGPATVTIAICEVDALSTEEVRRLERLGVVVIKKKLGRDVAFREFQTGEVIPIAKKKGAKKKKK